jgi:hypothetical protein
VLAIVLSHEVIMILLLHHKSRAKKWKISREILRSFALPRRRLACCRIKQEYTQKLVNHDWKDIKREKKRMVHFAGEQTFFVSASNGFKLAAATDGFSSKIF